MGSIISFGSIDWFGSTKSFFITAAVIMYPIHSADVWLKESSSLFPMMVRDRLYFQNKIQELENELVIAGG